MAYVIGLLVLLIGLVVSIGLHELGHMIPAKLFGVRVSRYMVGFGPTLWSRTRGETEYGLKAIPLGGYVRIVGMLPPSEVVVAKPRRGWIGEMIQAARDASDEEVLPGEEHRAFYRLSAPKKIVVMLGGPVTNLLIAVVLFGVVLVGIGLQGDPSTTVGVVGECVPPVDPPEDWSCTGADQETPASSAGVEPGDVLLSYGGRPIEEWSDFTAAVRNTEGDMIALVVERKGERVTLQVAPIVTERSVVGDDNLPVLDGNGQQSIEKVPFVGITPTAPLVRQPVSRVVPLVGEVVWETSKLMATLPARLVDVGQSVFGDKERDGSVIGLVGMGQVAGQISTEETTPFYGTAERVGDMLNLIASLNIALFVFNLIPLLPLDGGHVAGAVWEGAKRQVARWRGRPRPAPADMARMMPFAYGMFVVLAAMGLFLVVADIVRPVTVG